MLHRRFVAVLVSTALLAAFPLAQLHAAPRQASPHTQSSAASTAPTPRAAAAARSAAAGQVSTPFGSVNSLIDLLRRLILDAGSGSDSNG